MSFEGSVVAPAGTNFSYTLDATAVSDTGSPRKKGDIPSAATRSKRNGVVSPADIIHWEISRWGDVTRIMMANGMGQQGEIWTKGDLKVVRPPEGTGYYVDTDPPDQDRFIVDLGPYGYPHTAWIVPECYERQVKNKDSKALYFRLPIAQSPSADQPGREKFSPEKEAWIDEKTRQPLCVKEGGIAYAFRMMEPKPLEIPAEVMGVITAQSQAQQPFVTEIQQHSHGPGANTSK